MEYRCWKAKSAAYYKRKVINDLFKCLNILQSAVRERRYYSAQLNTLQQEKYSKYDLIQELETRLDSLQVVYAGVCSVIEDVQKANNELMLKMAELKGKVVRSDKLYQK